MKNNIDFVNEQIRYVSKMFCECGIDFYIVGAIAGYIDAGLPLQRSHDDLDLLVEEKNIDKIKEIFEKNDYIFIDNRFTSNQYLNEYGFPQGEEHDVYAKCKNSEFHIGFFLYIKDQNYYSLIDYYKEKGKQKRLLRTLPLETFDYQYNSIDIEYFDCKVKVARKELIYKNKLVMNREKDIFDLEKLRPYLNEDIINYLSTLKNKRKTTIENI